MSTKPKRAAAITPMQVPTKSPTKKPISTEALLRARALAFWLEILAASDAL